MSRVVHRWLVQRSVQRARFDTREAAFGNLQKKKKLVKNSQKKALHPSEVVATVRQRRPTFCDLIETIVHDVVLARLGVGTSGRNTQKRANPSHDELLETTSTCGAFFPCPAS